VAFRFDLLCNDMQLLLRNANTLLILVVIAISCLLAGCAKQQTTGILAPQKPLGKAEESLLKQIEDTPQQDRTGFMTKHRSEVMSYAIGNRAFGQRLNEVLGIKSQTGPK
jgi:hypothetical protein